MSKGLKALHDIVDTMPFAFIETNSMKYVKIIEKELKEYEKMKAIKDTTTFDKAIEDTLINACPNVAKKLKALKIIKNKECIFKGLSETTQEEYDLLKEVLL